MIKKAFSLIELMVVIAIIGILAAVAAPSYRDYVLRSKVARVMPVLQSLQTAITQQYETNGVMPQSFTHNGVSYSNNVYTAVTMGDIVAIFYAIHDLYGSTAVIANVAGLAGIHASYVDPTSNPTTSFSYSRVAIASTLSNGVHQKYCGRWSGATEEVPQEYYSGCSYCTNLLQVVTTGVTSSCS